MDPFAASDEAGQLFARMWIETPKDSGADSKTRKFFVAFIIAKEMVPFILQKINEYVKK